MDDLFKLKSIFSKLSNKVLLHLKGFLYIFIINSVTAGCLKFKSIWGDKNDCTLYKIAP